MIKYTNIPMRFDASKFSQDLREEIKEVCTANDIEWSVSGMNDVCGLFLDSKITGSTLWSYMHSYEKKKQHPAMDNFIMVCNTLGLDCRTYFILEY